LEKEVGEKMIDNQEAIQRAMNLGHSAAWDQDWDKAASFYHQALKMDPNQTKALTSLGLALIKMEDYQKALKCYQRAAEINPNDPLALENVAKLSESMRDLTVASEYSMKAAEIYLRNKDLNKAIENLERITRINPDDVEAHRMLAEENEQLGQKRKAVNEYLAVASLIQAGGDQEKALYFINLAQQIDPNNQKVLQALNLVKDFRQLPKPSAAIEVPNSIPVSKTRQLVEPQFENEAGLDPVSETKQVALTAIAEILFEGSNGDDSSSIDNSMSFNQAKRLRDTEKWSQVIMDLSCAIDLETQGEFENSIAALEHVLSLGLDHPAVYFNLGYLYFQTGHFENLVPVLQQIINVGDYALGTHFLLADFYYQTGELETASREFLNALKLADVGNISESKKGDLLNLYERLIDLFQKQSSLEQKERLCENIRNLLKRSDWRTVTQSWSTRINASSGRAADRSEK